MGERCRTSVLESWGVGGNALWAFHGLEKGELFRCTSFLWDGCIPRNCCWEGTTLAREPPWATCEPCAAEETLVAHPCRVYSQYECVTRGRNHMKGNWRATPLIACTGTACKLFGKALIAANVYAGFCKRSFVWYATTSSLKRTWASAALGFGKCLLIFCPVTCFVEFAQSKLMRACLGEAARSYLQGIFNKHFLQTRLLWKYSNRVFWQACFTIA